nr:MAG TPA: hypothetical protein [Caudoviricetes sp.]
MIIIAQIAQKRNKKDRSDEKQPFLFVHFRK